VAGALEQNRDQGEKCQRVTKAGHIQETKARCLTSVSEKILPLSSQVIHKRPLLFRFANRMAIGVTNRASISLGVIGWRMAGKKQSP
jgi:hypothetical protein